MQSTIDVDTALITKVSTVLYSHKESNELLRAECSKVASSGGYFTIRHFQDSAWFTEYTITYPKDNK